MSRFLIILLMGEPYPSADLGVDVLDHFLIPQLFEDDDLVVSQLIAIVSICDSGFSFRDLALWIPP